MPGVSSLRLLLFLREGESWDRREGTGALLAPRVGAPRLLRAPVLTLGAGPRLAGGCPVLCRVFGGVPGRHPLDASSTPLQL